MNKVICIFIVNIFFTNLACAQSTTYAINTEINTQIKAYPWFRTVAPVINKHYGWGESYNVRQVRIAVARYLMSKGFVTFTANCAQGPCQHYSYDDQKHAELLIGAFHNSRVQDDLSKVSPWVLVNGVNGELNEYTAIIKSWYVENCPNFPSNSICNDESIQGYKEREHDLLSLPR